MKNKKITKQPSKNLSFRLVRNLSEEGLPTSGNESNKQQEELF